MAETNLTPSAGYFNRPYGGPGVSGNRPPRDIVDYELQRDNRQSAFDFVQRYPKGFDRGLPYPMPSDQPVYGNQGAQSGNITNTFNPTVNVTGGTQTQQTQAAGGDIIKSPQTTDASTIGSVNTGDPKKEDPVIEKKPIKEDPDPVKEKPITAQVDQFIANTKADSAKTASEQPNYKSPYYTSAEDKATQQAATLFTGNKTASGHDEMITGSDFTGGGGAVTAESLGKEKDAGLNFVQQSYQDIFGRAPDKEGYDYWTSELNTGSLSPDAFIATLQGSPEAKARADSNQGGTKLVYEKVDDYLAGGGVGGDPSKSAYVQDDDVPAVNTTEYVQKIPMQDVDAGGNTGGGNTMTTSEAAIQDHQQSQASQSADNWLQDFYTQSGINSGNLDASAKAYWEGEAATKGKDAVKKIIEGTAKAQGTWNT